MFSKVAKAHLALLGANLFYGAGFTIAKTVMPRLIEPTGFIFIRVSIVTLLFWISFLGGPSYRTTFTKKDWRLLVLGGVFGVALNQLLFFMGLNITSPIHASIIMLSTPLLITVFAAIALKDRLSKDKMLGLFLGIAGAILIVNERGGNSQVAASPLGDLYIFLNAASYAIYLVLIKPMMQRYRPLILIRWIFLFGFLFVLPFSIREAMQIDWSLFQPADYFAVAFIVIACTFLTYLWNAYALQVLPPSTAGAYIYLQPLFAAIISVWVMGEAITLWKVVAALLVFAGVYLVNFGWKRKMMVSK